MMAKDKQAEDRLIKRQEMLAKKAEDAKGKCVKCWEVKPPSSVFALSTSMFYVETT